MNAYQRLQNAGENEAFAAAAAQFDAGKIGPYRFWAIATEFAIKALGSKGATEASPEQRDLFEAA